MLLPDKIFSTSLIFLLLSFTAYPQFHLHQTQVLVSVGPSLPIGNFASKDVLSDKSGLAKTGEAIDISFTSAIKNNIGLAATILAQRNPLDTKSLETSFKSTYPAYPNWHFNKKAWLSVSLQAGGYCEMPMQASNNISFIAKAMIGAVYLVSPALNGSSISDTAKAYAGQTSSKAFGLSFLLSAGLKYNLRRGIILMASLQYAGTNDISFHDIEITYSTFNVSNNVYYTSQRLLTVNGKQNASAVGLTIGIGLKL